MRTFLFIVFFALVSTAARSDISYLESGIGVTFDGCNFDKLINLKNGYVWKCSEYGYTYHYGIMTVLQVDGIAKLCVGDLDEAVEHFSDGNCYSGTLYRM